MSTSTEHLGLHQWEAGDSFLRADFNEDFAQIDAGVKAIHDLTTTAPVSGVYYALDEEPVHVTVGFRPKVVSFRKRGASGYPYYFGIATPLCGVGLYAYTECSKAECGSLTLEFTDDGFTIPALANYFNDSKGNVEYCAIP